ncbi:MAG: RNA polymerase sigma factor RpoD/SigA [Hydrogenobaculum sp.]
MYSDSEQEIINQYMKRVSSVKLLTPQEEKELAKRAKAGDKEALKALVEANLRFVVSVAKQYMGYGIPLSELIAAGNLGLLEAATRFDPDKNVKFISYAVWWVRQAIMQALSQQTGAVRIPVKHSHLISAVGLAYNELLKELEREPTYKEIADYINKKNIIREFKKETGFAPTEEELEQSMNQEHKYTVTEEDVKKCLQICKTPLSLDTPVGDNPDTLFVDLLSISDTDEIEEGVIKDVLEKELHDIISKLPEKERKVLELRYGLNGQEPLTLREIGDALGISRERVRQLETRAIKKLRSFALKRHLKDFLS